MASVRIEINKFDCELILPGLIKAGTCYYVIVRNIFVYIARNNFNINIIFINIANKVPSRPYVTSSKEIWEIKH